MTWRISVLAAACVAFLPALAAAQDMPGMAMPAANCSAPAALPPELSGWASMAPLTAAAQASGLDVAMLALGHAAVVTLRPTGEVQFVTQPEKPGGAATHGGMLALTIADAGTYQVSLGSGAWIDMLKEGKALWPSAHAHGVACTTIHKIVDFKLQPGRYVIQLSGNDAPTLSVMVSRKP